MADQPTGLFQNLYLNRYYKYMLYIGGITLILSLTNFVSIDVDTLRHFSVWTIILGMIGWFLHVLQNIIEDHLQAKDLIHQIPDHTAYEYFNVLNAFRVMRMFFILIIWFVVLTSLY